MQELTQIAKQHPESVAFVFNEYGYGHLPISGVSVHAMAIKFGHPFLTDLANHISTEAEYSGFNFGEIIRPALNVIKPNPPKATAPPKGTANRSGRRTTTKKPATTGDFDTWTNSAATGRQPIGLISVVDNQKRAEIRNTTVPNNIGNRAATVLNIAPNPHTMQKPKFFDTVLNVLERGTGIFGNIKNSQFQRQMEQATTKRRNNTALIVGIVLIVLLLGGLLLFKNKKIVK
jgi:hypothetical protein